MMHAQLCDLVCALCDADTVGPLAAELWAAVEHEVADFAARRASAKDESLRRNAYHFLSLVLPPPRFVVFACDELLPEDGSASARVALLTMVSDAMAAAEPEPGQAAEEGVRDAFRSCVDQRAALDNSA